MWFDMPALSYCKLQALTRLLLLPTQLQAIAENPGFLQLRRIDAAREIATTLSQSANRVFLDSNQLLLNVDNFHYDEYVAGWRLSGGGTAKTMEAAHWRLGCQTTPQPFLSPALVLFPFHRKALKPKDAKK